MEIKFVERKQVIDDILDNINKGTKLDDEVKQLLIDFSKTVNSIKYDKFVSQNKI